MRSIGRSVSSSRRCASATRCPTQPRADRRARRFPKAPRKVATAHRHARGERIERMIRLQIGAQPVEQSGELFAVLALGNRLVDELRLRALPMRRHDEPPRDLIRRVRAGELAQHVQAAIESGRGAGGGRDVAIVDIEHVRIEPHARIAAREIVGPRPVRRGRAAVEQARRREHVRAEAQSDDHARRVRAPREARRAAPPAAFRRDRATTAR